MMGVESAKACDAPRFIAGVIWFGRCWSLIFSAFWNPWWQRYRFGLGLGVYDGAFLGHRCQQSVHFDTDIMNGVIKGRGYSFSVVVTWIAGLSRL